MSGVNIPITGDASSLVAATNKANAALNSMGTAADNASKKITPAMGSMSSGASKAAAAMGPLGGVLSKISPQAGAAASSIAGMSGAVMGLSGAMEAAGGAAVLLEVALGPIGLAMAAVTVLVAGAVAIYSELEAQSEQTAASQKLLAEATDEVTAANGRVVDGQRTLRDLMGLQTEADVDNEARSKAYAKSREADQKIALEQTRLEGLARATNAIKYKQDLLSQVDALQVQRAALGAAAIDEANAAGAAAVYAFNKKKSDEDAAARDKLAGQAKAAQAKREANASREQAEIEKDNAAAHAEYVKMDAERVAKAREHIDGINEQITATNKLTEAVRRQGMTEWETTAASGAAIDANLRKQIAVNTKLGLDTKALEDARVTNHANTAAALDAIDEERHATEKKTAEDAAQIDKDANKAKKEAAMDVANFMAEQATAGLNAMAEGFGKAQDAANETANQLTSQLIEGDEHYTKSQKAQLVKRIAEQRAAAKEAFALAKAARLAEAVITTAMAVINAYNSGVAVPIAGVVLGPAMAIAAGVTGAISIATIAAEQPSFHSGKLPDEMNATILKREAVLNTTASAAMGRGQIEAMNNGMTAGRSQGPAPIVIGHRVFEAGLKRSLDSAGVLREALHAGAVYGHRSNRRVSSV